MSKKFNVAVVGATGAVGETILSILEQRDFPIDNLYPLASANSAGKKVFCQGKSWTVQDLDTFDFSQAQVGLFSAGGNISEKYAPIAAEAGCVVIDNTAHFRRDKDIPLVVPEVNPHAIAGYTQRNIIANPNCSTIQMLVALKPIYDAVGIERINVATYQAVSGSGKEAISELIDQTTKLLGGNTEVDVEVYPKQIAFNVIPHIDVFQENGYTKEEMKLVHETRKILDDDAIGVSATAIRIPVVGGHSESINVKLKNSFEVEEVRQLLNESDGVVVQDNPTTNTYPMPIYAEGKDEVFVGRIRRDFSQKNTLNLWVVSDNLRKGAATNTIQIAEYLLENKLI